MVEKEKKSEDGSAPEARTSPAVYVLRREMRIANLYFVHRLTRPPLIYDALRTICRECGEQKTRHAELINDRPIIGCSSFEPLITRNRRSGLRIIQKVIERIRKEAEPEEILALRRPIETEKVRRTYIYLLQKAIAILEDRTLERRQKLSPSGLIISVMEPRYSEQDRARAMRFAESVTEKIGRLEGAVLAAVEEHEHPAVPDPEDRQTGFNFVFPNVQQGTAAADLNDMVAMNLERAKVN